eukprot:g4094.t1
MSGLFDDRHLIVTSDSTKQLKAGHVSSRASADPSTDDLKATRGVTVSELIERTSPKNPSKQRALFTDEDLVAHPELKVRHSDALLRGNSAWSGLARVASMSTEEKRRVMGKGYFHHGAVPPVPPPPPPSATSPPLPKSNDLESKVNELRRKLASMKAEESRIASGVDMERVPTPTDHDMAGGHSREFNEVLAKIKDDAAADIERLFENEAF